MPSCSRAKNPRGVEIVFTEADHKYSSVIDGKELVYVSGTTFISKFFPPFDPTGAITRACAKKNGLTVESMKAQWREKAEKSCIYGTKIHETMEDHILGRKLRNKPADERERVVMANAEKLAGKLLDRLEILGSEKIIFDERLGIAGTIDLLGRSKKDGKVFIIDYKTSAKIETENKYRNFGLDPIRHIPAINFHEYGMQLNLYEYILKYGEYIKPDEKVGKVLIHITETGAKCHVLPEYQKEIHDMVDYFQKGLVR